MPEPTWQRANPEDLVKALPANVCGRSATRTLRMLGVCIVAIAMMANPAMARGTASSSFTVGIRIQSVPSPVMTPEQLNTRNKALYDEQKISEPMKLLADVSDPVGTSTPGQTASSTSVVTP